MYCQPIRPKTILFLQHNNYHILPHFDTIFTLNNISKQFIRSLQGIAEAFNKTSYHASWSCIILMLLKHIIFTLYAINLESRLLQLIELKYVKIIISGELCNLIVYKNFKYFDRSILALTFHWYGWPVVKTTIPMVS